MPSRYFSNHHPFIKRAIRSYKKTLGSVGVRLKKIDKYFKKNLILVGVRLKKIDKYFKKNIVRNIALLYVWVIIFGLFSTDYSASIIINLWQSILYLFNNSNGFLCNLAYLSPILTAWAKPTKPLRLLFFLPLMGNVFHYGFFVRDYYDFWGLWLSLPISFYAAINIARFHYLPPITQWPPFIVKMKEIDLAIDKYFYKPLGGVINDVKKKLQARPQRQNKKQWWS